MQIFKNGLGTKSVSTLLKSKWAGQNDRTGAVKPLDYISNIICNKHISKLFHVGICFNISVAFSF